MKPGEREALRAQIAAKNLHQVPSRKARVEQVAQARSRGHFAIRQQTRETNVECAVRIRALKLSAHETHVAIMKAIDSAEHLRAEVTRPWKIQN